MEQHHILPRRFGGGDNEDNLVTLCASCHRGIESIYDKQFWASVGLRPSSDEHSVEEFADRRLAFDESYGATPKTQVYRWYVEWCRGGDVEPVSQHSFTKTLERLPPVESKRAYIDNEQQRCFLGLSQKSLVDAV